MTSQPNQPKKLFREKSLERLSSPEQLDQMMQVVSPKVWLPLATAGFLVVAAATWSVLGQIPITVNGQAILTRPRVLKSLQITTEGQITKIEIEPGIKIKKGDKIATIEQPQLEKQIEQERAKKLDLENQNKLTNRAFIQGINLQRENLKQQLDNLQSNLAATKRFGPIVGEKSSQSIDARRRSLQQSLQQAQGSTSTLRRRMKVREELWKKDAISEDLFLESKNQLDANLTQISELEAQLQENELQNVDIESKRVENSNSIEQIKTKMQELDVTEQQLVEQELNKRFENNNAIKELERSIAQLVLEKKNKSEILSPFTGRVTEVPIVAGQAVSAGSRIASVDTSGDKAEFKSVMYFADKDGRQIEPGMTVQVTPSNVSRERFGGIVGKVTEISEQAVSVEEMVAITGNENLANTIAQNLSSSGSSIVQIVAKLERNPDDSSKFIWSSSQGPDDFQMKPGTTAQVKVVTDTMAPIEFVIPILREWTGIQ